MQKGVYVFSKNLKVSKEMANILKLNVYENYYF